MTLLYCIDLPYCIRRSQELNRRNRPRMSEYKVVTCSGGKRSCFSLRSADFSTDGRATGDRRSGVKLTKTFGPKSSDSDRSFPELGDYVSRTSASRRQRVTVEGSAAQMTHDILGDQERQMESKDVCDIKISL